MIFLCLIVKIKAVKISRSFLDADDEDESDASFRSSEIKRDEIVPDVTSSASSVITGFLHTARQRLNSTGLITAGLINQTSGVVDEASEVN